jgi:predicted DNA-binding transcriptional regulator
MHLMANDRAVGGAILGGSIIGIILYGVLLVYWWETTVRVTAFIGVALILAILAWIGYTMATTPPPEPIADIPEAGAPSGEAKAEAKTEGK